MKGKELKLFDISHELDYETNHPYTMKNKEGLCISAIGRSLFIISRNTRYQEDVDKMLRLCQIHASKYFASSEELQ